MKQYWVEEGKQDFQPSEIPCIIPLRLLKDITWNFSFSANCWYNWLPDKDHYDWNKLFGVTDFFTANNRSSVMEVFRPFAESEGFMELAMYTNDSRANFKQSNVLLVCPVKEEVMSKLTPLSNRNWKLDIQCKDKKVEQIMSLDKNPFLLRCIKLWIGGADNSNGIYGGKASQRMDILFESKINYK